MKTKQTSSFSLGPLLTTVLLGVAISLLMYTNVFYHYLNAIIFLLFGLYFSFCSARIKGMKTKKDAMLNFIDQFIVSLSIHKTLLATVRSVEEVIDKRIKKELITFTEGEPLEKIEYLAHYFKHSMYDAFLDIIKTYLDQGGDILLASAALLKEVAEERANALSISQLHSQKMGELIVGWGFVLLVIAMLRFVVSDIYQSLIANITFAYGLEVFNVLILTSFVFYFKIVMTTQEQKNKPLKKSDRYLPIQEFVKTFTIFRMSLSTTSNVYKTLEKTASYSQGVMSHHLYILLGELKTTTSLTPFISLGAKFKEPLVKNILINIYQLMINGGESAMLLEFNYLFDRLYELNSKATLDTFKRKHETLGQMPMLGSGLLVMIIMVGVIGLLGAMLYV